MHVKCVSVISHLKICIMDCDCSRQHDWSHEHVYLLFQIRSKDRHVDCGSSHEPQQRRSGSVSSRWPFVCCGWLWRPGLPKHRRGLWSTNQWVDTGNTHCLYMVDIYINRPCLLYFSFLLRLHISILPGMFVYGAVCWLCKCWASIILTQAQLCSASQHLSLPLATATALFLPGFISCCVFRRHFFDGMQRLHIVSFVKKINPRDVCMW